MSSSARGPMEASMPSTHASPTLINQCKFSNQNTREMFKIMVLQHAVWYHDAWDWLCQQDQSQLTYQTLFLQCQFLEFHCELYQKAKEKGHAEFTSLSTVTSSAYPKCPQCGYYHSPGNCMMHGKECYRCHGCNDFTTLCQRRLQKLSWGSRAKCPKDAGTLPWWSNQSGIRCKTSCSPRHHTCWQSREPSHSPSSSLADVTGDPHSSTTTRTASRLSQHVHYQQHGDLRWLSPGRYPTDQAHKYHILHPASPDNQDWHEVPDRKIDPSAKVNTIPLNRYRKTFPQEMYWEWLSQTLIPQPYQPLLDLPWQQATALPRPIHCQHQACLPGQVIPNMLLMSLWMPRAHIFFSHVLHQNGQGYSSSMCLTKWLRHT